MGLLIGMVEWRGGDRRGGFQDRRWWISRLARSVVVGFWLSTLWLLSARLIVFFFFSSWWLCGGCFLWMWLLLVVFGGLFVFFFSLWWLFLVVVAVVGGGFGRLSFGFARIGGGFAGLSGGLAWMWVAVVVAGFLKIFFLWCILDTETKRKRDSENWLRKKRERGDEINIEINKKWDIDCIVKLNSIIKKNIFWNNKMR